MINKQVIENSAFFKGDIHFSLIYFFFFFSYIVHSKIYFRIFPYIVTINNLLQQKI